jgi:tetratricopeptide (TPR) repeat protein
VPPKEPLASESDRQQQGKDLVVTVGMVAAGLVAVLGFGMLFSLWWRAAIRDDYEVLRIASQEFVKGRAVVAGHLAEKVEFDDSPALDESLDDVEEDPNVPMSRAATEALEARKEREEWNRLRNFLIGVGKVAQSDKEEDLRKRREILYDAVPYLESARNAGFPPGRHTQGNRILGEALFQLGRYNEAIATLRTAIDRDPTLRRVLTPLLAEAHLKADSPQDEEGLATISKLLSDPTLPPQQRWRGEVIQLRALLKLKKWKEISDLANRILQSAPTGDLLQQAPETEYRNQVTLLRAAAIVAEASDHFGNEPAENPEDIDRLFPQLTEAMQQLNELQRESTPMIASRAGLWSAKASLIRGLIDEALSKLTTVRLQRPFGAAAIIAGLEELELLAMHGRGDEMLQTIRFVIREIGDAEGFDPGTVTFNEFQQRVAGAIKLLRQNGKYENAIDVARSLYPVIDASEALTQEGIAYREWAIATIAEGTNLQGEVARNASSLARSRYRAAGDAFEQAAQLQFNTEAYLGTQWDAIDAYQKGRHFAQSVQLLEPYLRYEERRRQPRGLVAFGRALLAEDQIERAIHTLTTCVVEFPRDPLRYDARLLAALAYAEKGDLDNARTLLNDNLQDGELTPQSPAWQDSLFTLGELLYKRADRNHLLAAKADPQKQFEMLRDNQPIADEAVRVLEQAVERYWPVEPPADDLADASFNEEAARRAEAAAYLAARAHLLKSRWPRLQAESSEILEAAKRTLRTQAEQELQSALNAFIRLRRHLSDREDEQRLATNERAMLRNCLVAEADVLREMNRLEDAARAYQEVEQRYVNEPPALEAILGRASCSRQLGRLQEADMLIRQASAVLDRIPAEWNGRFEETTRFDRRGWKNLLTWMNDRIDNSGA